MINFTVPYVVLLVVGALLLSALIGVSARRRHSEGAFAFVLLLLAGLIWALSYAGELLAEPLTLKLLLAKLRYLGIIVAPLAWVLFVARYTHLDSWLNRRTFTLLATPPLITVFIIWSNEAHGLFWRELSFGSAQTMPAIQVSYGPWFWLHAGFSYGLLLLGGWLLFRVTFYSHQLYRWQGGLLLLSLSCVWLTNAAYLLHLWPLGSLDPAPLSFALSSILIGWGLLRFRLLDVAPIAPGAIISAMADGVLVVDPRGQVVDVNAAAAHILACHLRLAVGRPAASLLAPYPELAEACRLGRAFASELIIEHPPSVRSYVARLIPLSDRSGRHLGTLIQFHDITERKAAEERRHLVALRRHAEQILLQRVARAVSANLSLETIFATTVAQIHAAFGYQLVSLYLVEESQLVLKAQIGYTNIAPQIPLDQSLGGQISQAWRPRFIRDTSHEPSLAIGTPAATAAIMLPLRRGKDHTQSCPLGLLCVESTGEPSLGDDDYSLLQLLAEQVSVAIVNARLFSDLRASEAAAAAAARAKSEFLANMSHEIRTPLNAVLGAVSLILATSPTPEQRRLLDLIRTSGTALLNQLSDILDFAMLESGRLPLNLIPFDPRQCLSEALDLVRPQALVKQISLRAGIAEQTPTCLISDRDRLRQILLLLLDNAVKFTDAGEVSLTLSSHLRADQRYELEIIVRDTGPGLSPELAARLFQSFAQGHGAANRRHGGTGLGLAMARRLSELLGGSLTVSSTPGHGATFTVTISADPAPPQFHFFLPGIVPRLRGRRLLILAPSAEERWIISLQTRAWGMLPVAPYTSAAALDLLRRDEPFDLALVSIQADDEASPHLIQDLRALRSAEHLPILVLGTPTARLQRCQSVIGGVQSWLPGPIKATQLHAMLLTLLAPAVEPSEAELLTSLNVLLVEDDPTNQLLIEHLLGLTGHKVTAVTSAAAALAALERQRFDLALLDVQLPHMDGLELARTICRRWPRQDRPPLVALTANALIGDRERCLAAGMDDYLCKPVNLDALQQLLARYQPPTTAPVSMPNLPSQISPHAFAIVVRTYLDDTSRLIEAMQGAAELANAALLTRLAHKLKSSSAIVGAMPLSRLCSELEAGAHDADPDQLCATVAAISAEYQRTSALLSERLQSRACGQTYS
jgi:signal transduction histidine kinase/DNA-binding response OmpR family regulator/PAS domain-containing protein/HPt (histidine-containing phosphotransfer) domain-containing protein